MDSSGSITDRLQPVPLLSLLAGIISGIIFHNNFIETAPWLSYTLLGASFLVAGITAIRRNLRLFTICAGALLGWCATFIAYPRQFDEQPAKGTVYEGVITKINRGSSTSLLIDIDREIIADSTFRVAPFRICDYPGGLTKEIVEGAIVIVSGDFTYPKIETTLPMEDDRSQWYASQGVSLVCFSHEGQLKRMGMSRNPLYALARARQQLSNRFICSRLDPDAAAFFAAITTGDTSALDPEERANFAAAGLAHILALSGAHLAVIAAIISLLLIPISIAGGYYARWWLTIAILWLYATLTGLSPSVVRATIMITAVVLSIIADRPHSSLNALCAAAIAILLSKPASLTMPGFQLSFIATLSIILFSNRLNPFNYKEKKRRWALSLIIVTLAATIGTAPLVAWHFHQLPLYFLPGNLVAVIILPVAIFGGLLFLALSALGIGTGWLCWCMNLIYKALNIVVGWVTTLPGATLDNLYFPAWMLIPMYLTLAALFLLIWRKRRAYFIGFVALAIFTIGIVVLCRPRYQPYGVYIASRYSHTELIAHHRDTLTIFTTDKPVNFPADSAQWSRNYRNFIGSRGIRHLEIRPASSAGIITSGAHTYKFSTDTAAMRQLTTYTILLRPTLGTPPKSENILIPTFPDVEAPTPNSNHTPASQSLYPTSNTHYPSAKRETMLLPADTFLIARNINRGPLTRLLDFLTANNIPYRKL